ncbi:GlxA family transcriptional regulator [Rhodococcoides fascians A21d2]|uniref:GlxA family transcriptional regulator n=1 Tax=Rhodococcoides fascians TaxID=1828 RepID=UPI000569C45D|nr:GlxA family transcriptional regulator [Rhodococcus fascians]QII00234.1 GlxA family transcriptional regulator [Rhodococcus fascians A21d2]
MSSRAQRVGVLVFDDMKLLDLAGPAEVFAEANKIGADYRVSLVSVDGRDVRTSMGLKLPVDSSAKSLESFDTMVVMGGEAFPAGEVTDELASAASRMSDRASRTASVCTGAFVLAAAGLLDGKRATTHWHHARELARRYPGIRVEPDAIVVEDGLTYTSAGVTAGIDLALAFVEEDFGVEVARGVARALVVYLRREGGQTQYSDSLIVPVRETSLLRGVVSAITADPAGEHTATSMAVLARVSPRHLSRLFRDEMAMTPSKYVELVRLDKAKTLLDMGHSVTRVAQDSGFVSSESLRRAFITHMSVPPSQYQRRFSSVRNSPAGNPPDGLTRTG